MREKSTLAGPATESGLTGPGPVANDFDGIVGSAFVPCSGKGWTRRQARDGALGEALERYAAMTWRPQRTISATYDGLGRPALHPRDLVLFADHQYDVVPYQPWLPETELEWVPAQSLVTGNDLWIPLLAAHLGYEPPAGAALFPATSNGFAAGPDPAGATLRALLEVVERDAFLIAWSHRLPGRCVAAADVPDYRTRALAAAYARRGTELVVHLLPTDTSAAVALAIAWSDRAPAAVTGLAASLDPVAATRSAVFEAAQARPSLCARVRLPEAQALMAEHAAGRRRSRRARGARRGSRIRAALVRRERSPARRDQAAGDAGPDRAEVRAGAVGRAESRPAPSGVRTTR